jgi:hypothetical protein
MDKSAAWSYPGGAFVSTLLPAQIEMQSIVTENSHKFEAARIRRLGRSRPVFSLWCTLGLVRAPDRSMRPGGGSFDSGSLPVAPGEWPGAVQVVTVPLWTAGPAMAVRLPPGWDQARRSPGWQGPTSRESELEPTAGSRAGPRVGSEGLRRAAAAVGASGVRPGPGLRLPEEPASL